jgi:hypothetical protein
MRVFALAFVTAFVVTIGGLAIFAPASPEAIIAIVFGGSFICGFLLGEMK